MQIYDLTVSDVSALIGHLGAITATTSPSADETGAWIDQVAGRVNVLLRAQGIDPASVVSTATGRMLELYHSCRSYIALYVAARWHVANRNGDTDLATSYRIQFDEWLVSLRQDRGAETGQPQGFLTNMIPGSARETRWGPGGYR